jgi:hypothetical protein
MAEGDTPKIVVDSDWKSQARAEKERLAAAEKAKAQEKAAKAPATAGPGASPGPGVGAPGGHEQEELPPADFQSLLGTMITQALMYMGGFPDPQTGQAVVSLEYARFHIDMLAVLEEKTKGNLTPQEAQDLNQALNQLRLRFVEITKVVAQMAERRAKGGIPGMGGPMGPMPGPGMGM